MVHNELQPNPAIITFHKLYTILIVAAPNSMLAQFCLKCPLPSGDVGPGWVRSAVNPAVLGQVSPAGLCQIG